MPPASWARPFKKPTTEVQLDVTDLTEANEAIRQFLDPVLNGQAHGHWNPMSWRWE